jgi:hypothetical protein
LTFTQPCVRVYVETSFCADGRLTAAALGRRIGSDRSVGSVVPTLGGQAFGRTIGGVRRPAPSSLTGNREVNAGPFRGANFPHNRFHREIRSIPSHLRITSGRAAQTRCHTGVATGTIWQNATNEPIFDKLSVSHNNKIRLRLRRILALTRDLTSRWLSGDRGWSPRGNRRMLVRRWTPMAAVEMKRRMFANKTEKRLVRR